MRYLKTVVEALVWIEKDNCFKLPGNPMLYEIPHTKKCTLQNYSSLKEITINVIGEVFSESID